MGQQKTYEIECPGCKEEVEVDFTEDQITYGPNRIDVIVCPACEVEFEFVCVDGLIVPIQQDTEPLDDDDEEDDDEEEDDDDGDEEDDDDEQEDE
jgi:transcription elongation factor Elf1